MDDKTLLFLLKGGHLNMNERIERGLWPHPALPFEQIVTFLVNALEQGEVWFPVPWEPPRPGEMIREGGTIERQRQNRYAYRTIASHPLSPITPLHTTETIFSTAREAAIHYLRWDLNLPGDLDGWEVV